MATFECIINIQCNPVREADNAEEFIEDLIYEYNTQCEGLFEIDRGDITEISGDDEEDT
jgi:hypothetical protein